MNLSTVVAIRHVAFEDMGSFAPVCVAAGLGIRYVEAGADDLTALDALAPALLVVLGGPIGAYEEADYPFVCDELRLLEQRLAAGLPTLGICLGAQMMARVLGAAVYPGLAKEIGWAPVTLTTEGRGSVLAPLAVADPAGAAAGPGGEGIPVLHWHGDTFDLPAGATRLASTALTPNQAFTWGARSVGLGLQFHLEATAAGIERWLIGHACEIAAAPGVSVGSLRSDTARVGGAVARVGPGILAAWLRQVGVGKER